MKAKTKHQWKSEGKKLYCDGCSELMEVADKSLKKSKPKKDDDDVIALGD